MKIPILNYEYKTVVCWGNDDFVLKVIDAWGHDKKYFDKENYRAQTFMTRHCVPVIALRAKPSTPDEIATLCHEAVHAVDYIFDSIGDDNRGELFAHSIAAIVRKVLKEKAD